MRLATVYPPDKGQRTILLERAKEVRVIPIGQKLRPVLGVLIAGMLTWAVMALLPTLPERASTPTTAPALHSAAGTPARSRVRRFDGSQTLKRGDTVVVHQDGKSRVRQVIGTPMEPVLAKRGEALHGFFLAGDGGYVVTSGTEMKVVRPEDILVIVESMDAQEK